MDDHKLTVTHEDIKYTIHRKCICGKVGCWLGYDSNDQWIHYQFGEYFEEFQGHIRKPPAPLI